MTTTKEQRRRKTQDDIPFDATAGAFKMRPACRYLGGISEISLRRLIKSGQIKPNRELRHLLIPRVELDRFLEAK
jgi:hypothetical protein